MRFALTLACLLAPAGLTAQRTVTRADAVTAALARGARAALGRADTTAALGGVRAARAFPNPTFSGSYTKDTPNYHALGDLPLDLPWLRSPRIGAAEAARDAARYRFAFERAAIRFDVDTTYTRSLAAALHARLSRRTAADADSLLKVAELRRDLPAFRGAIVDARSRQPVCAELSVRSRQGRSKQSEPQSAPAGHRLFPPTAAAQLERRRSHARDRRTGSCERGARPDAP